MLKKVLTFYLKFDRILFVRRSGGMADAQASGACSRKAVWVQVPSPASMKRSSEKSEDLFLVLISFSHPPYPLGPQNICLFPIV